MGADCVDDPAGQARRTTARGERSRGSGRSTISWSTRSDLSPVFHPWNGSIDAPGIWCPEWPRGGLSANEIKGACVLPSRPRPACRSTGRIHISDFRPHHLRCEGSTAVHPLWCGNRQQWVVSRPSRSSGLCRLAPEREVRLYLVAPRCCLHNITALDITGGLSAGMPLRKAL